MAAATRLPTQADCGALAELAHGLLHQRLASCLRAAGDTYTDDDVMRVLSGGPAWPREEDLFRQVFKVSSPTMPGRREEAWNYKLQRMLYRFVEQAEKYIKGNGWRLEQFGVEVFMANNLDYSLAQTYCLQLTPTPKPVYDRRVFGPMADELPLSGLLPGR